MKLLRIILPSMAVVFVGLLVACMARTEKVAEKASDGCAMMAKDGASACSPTAAPSVDTRPMDPEKDGASAISPTAAPSVYTCPMDPEVVSDKPGKCPKCGMNLVAKHEKPKGDQYTCPMDPEVVSDKPGKCPKCGMNLVRKEEKPKGDQYTCPMDPEVVSNKPGKCPKCGMNLVRKEEKPKGDQKPAGKNDSGGDSGHSGHMHNH